MPSAVSIQSVSKDFKSDFWKPTVRVLKNISFEVPEGGIFGLVGPNGAGKTTTLKILLGLIYPTVGSATIFGKSIRETEFKKDLGYLPEAAYYYDFLKPTEVIDFYGRLFGLSKKERSQKTEELLHLVGLENARNTRLRNFSKGMLQRVGIAQALVNDPKLLILDEPMSGLDPIGRKEVRDIILKLSQANKTVLFSSHILSDIEAICDNVVIIVGGEVRALGPLTNLVQAKVKSTEVVFEGGEPFDLPGNWIPGVSKRQIGNSLTLTVTELVHLPEVLLVGQQKGFKLISVVPHKESLEDLFIQQAGLKL